MNWLELCTCARSFKFFHQRVVKYKIKAHFLGGSATTLQMITTQQPFYNIESAFIVHSNVQTILQLEVRKLYTESGHRFIVVFLWPVKNAKLEEGVTRKFRWARFKIVVSSKQISTNEDKFHFKPVSLFSWLFWFKL